MERTIFGDATGGQCLAPIVDVPEVGKVGSLACWEHIQPLLKFHTFSQGKQIHVGAWPPLDPFMDGSPGFYSMSDEGCLTASRAYAMESQTFVLHVSTLLTQSGLELMGTVGSPIMGSPAVGKSAILGPDGRILATTKTGEEELLVADLDMSLITKTRTFADAAGHCEYCLF
jgi:nitrilase